MSDDLSGLRAELNELPTKLRSDLRPMLPFTKAEPRGWRDVARCLLGRHRVSLAGRVAGMFIERCSCGAMRVNRRHWFESHPFRITDEQGFTRRQRKEHRRITEAVERTMAEHFPSE